MRVRSRTEDVAGFPCGVRRGEGPGKDTRDDIVWGNGGEITCMDLPTRVKNGTYYHDPSNAIGPSNAKMWEIHLPRSSSSIHRLKVFNVAFLACWDGTCQVSRKETHSVSLQKSDKVGSAHFKLRFPITEKRQVRTVLTPRSSSSLPPPSTATQ